MRRLMTINDFEEQVISEFKALPFEYLFLIKDKEVIDTVVSQWVKNQSYDDYLNYVTAVLSLKNEHLYIDNRRYCLDVSRSLLDEMIVSFAESFFYDEKSVYEWDIQPFTRGKAKGRVEPLNLRNFFTDIFDVSYDRIYVNNEGTLSRLYNITGDDKYLRGEI